MSKAKSKVLEIQSLAMSLRSVGFHCFTDYQAHVNIFSVSLYDGEWDAKKKPVDDEFKVNDDEYNINKSNKIIDQLKSILNEKNTLQKLTYS